MSTLQQIYHHQNEIQHIVIISLIFGEQLRFSLTLYYSSGTSPNVYKLCGGQ